MVVTVAKLAAALRVDNPADADVARLLTMAKLVVRRRVPRAPTAVCDECVIRLAAYLYDQPPSAPGATHAGAWLNSGAASLAAPWASHGLTAEG